MRKPKVLYKRTKKNIMFIIIIGKDQTAIEVIILLVIWWRG